MFVSQDMLPLYMRPKLHTSSQHSGNYSNCGSLQGAGNSLHYHLTVTERGKCSLVSRLACIACGLVLLITGGIWLHQLEEV
jgi:hypothetical protein